MGHYLVADDAHPYGRLVRCDKCRNLLAGSRLTAAEQQVKVSDITGGGSAAVLRAAAAAILERPAGFWTIWGPPGTAKSFFLNAVGAGLCRAGVQAVYYHGADLRAALYADMDGDSANGEYLRRVTCLLVDELDKYYLTDYGTKELQTLIDHRYRNMRSHLTLLAANRDPHDAKPWLPDDVLSRLEDGRFRRPWPAGHGAAPAEFKDGMIPSVYHVRGSDMRPRLRNQEETTPR